MSHRDIADHLGLTIETLSRTITGMEEAGIVARRSNHGLLLNFFSEVATRLKFLRHITETDVRHTSAAVLVGLLEESKQRRAG
jgi:hypothetical protein